jgi:hypothetical protein
MSTAIFKDRGNNDVIFNNVEFSPKSWSGSDKGGYKRCTIEAFGTPSELLELTEMLRFDATVYNDIGIPVWNGFVNEVTVFLGSMSIGFKLSGMSNKVRVFYNSIKTSGASRSKYTDWEQDYDSQANYGIMERILSASDISDAAAEVRASKGLRVLSSPVHALSFEGNANRAYARIECLGWYYTLGWRMFRELRGYESYVGTGQLNQNLGHGIISSEIGFNPDNNSISIIGNQLRIFKDGEKVRVSGSSSNNGLFTINEIGNRTYELYETPSGLSDDDITDAYSLMNSKYDLYDLLKVSDSTSNDGYYFIENVVSNKVEVRPSPLVTEYVVPVHLEAGSTLTLIDSVVEEYPGSTITVKGQVQKMARQFTPSAAGSWHYKEIQLKIKKVGSPSDNVQVSLATDAGSQSYSIIETVTVAGSSILDSYDWITFTFSGSNALTGGSDYAIIVTRTGAVSDANYYVFQLDDQSPNSGVVYISDGVTWEAHPNDADLLFQITGSEETSVQIENVLEATNQLLAEYYVEVDSGVQDTLYMNNYKVGIVRMEELLAFGYGGGTLDLVAIVDLKRNLYIKPKEAYEGAGTAYKISTNGKIKDSAGNPVQDGELLHGNWIELDDAFASYGFSINMFRTYISECEWDDDNKVLKIIPALEDPTDKLKLITNG